MFVIKENGEIEINDLEYDDIPVKKGSSDDVELEGSVRKIDLWKDIIYNISGSKEKLRWNPDIEKAYDPFLINRAFCSDNDTIPAISLLNMLKDLPKEAHYLYLNIAVQPKKKRYIPFLKSSETDKNIQLLSEMLQISKYVLCDYMKILTLDQKAKLIDELNKFRTLNDFKKKEKKKKSE